MFNFLQKCLNLKKKKKKRPASDIILFINPYFANIILQHFIGLLADNPSPHVIIRNFAAVVYNAVEITVINME